MNDSQGSVGLFPDERTQWCEKVDAALPQVSPQAKPQAKPQAALPGAWGGATWGFRAQLRSQPWVQVLTLTVEEGGRAGSGPLLPWFPLGSRAARACFRFGGEGCLDVLLGACLVRRGPLAPCFG